MVSDEMFFSRVPVVGEIVHFERRTYEVVRVDHYPERNSGPEGDPNDPGFGIPEDAEIFLVRKEVPGDLFDASSGGIARDPLDDIHDKAVGLLQRENPPKEVEEGLDLIVAIARYRSGSVDLESEDHNRRDG